MVVICCANMWPHTTNTKRPFSFHRPSISLSIYPAGYRPQLNPTTTTPATTPKHKPLHQTHTHRKKKIKIKRKKKFNYVIGRGTVVTATAAVVCVSSELVGQSFLSAADPLSLSLGIQTPQAVIRSAPGLITLKTQGRCSTLLSAVQ